MRDKIGCKTNWLTGISCYFLYFSKFVTCKFAESKNQVKQTFNDEFKQNCQCTVQSSYLALHGSLN